MKKASYLILTMVLVTAAFLGGTWYQHRLGEAGSAGSRKVLYYVDPMHPAYRSDKPGIAPDCGMQLEAVYADGGAATPGAEGGASPRPAGAVSIDQDKQQLLGVRVAAVERAPGKHAVRLFGRVVQDETRAYMLNAATEGFIHQLSAVTTGSHVKKGQWLASVFSVEVRTPLQAYITALDVQDQDPTARKEAGVNLAAGTTANSSARFTVERLKGIGMSDRQIDEVRRTRQIPVTIAIYSPTEGFVTARNVSLGQKFDKGAEWYRIANLDKVWILADVFENEAAYLKPGMRAQVTLPKQGKSLPARVSEVLPQFDGATRTMKVRLEADNPGYVLRPEMFVDVELSIELPAAMSIPVDAVVDSGLRKTVFVERGQGSFEPRVVETGWRFGERVEVVKGLAPGERIVTSGTFLVDSESRLKSAAAGVYGAPAKDPVCGMEVDEAKARAAGKTLSRDGKTWFFCSDQCMRKFEAAPGSYAEQSAAEHKHGAL
ncbi:MAG TPA: efflux RND transporter periplasmic adaptor subunit [Anaeromyxobacteraceae bacterium]